MPAFTGIPGFTFPGCRGLWEQMLSQFGAVSLLRENNTQLKYIIGYKFEYSLEKGVSTNSKFKKLTNNTNITKSEKIRYFMY